MGSLRKLHRWHAQEPRQSQGAGVVAGIRCHLRSETRQKLKIPRRLLALESKRNQIQRLRSVTPADGAGPPRVVFIGSSFPDGGRHAAQLLLGYGVTIDGKESSLLSPPRAS
jgi:hypothetical protein